MNKSAASEPADNTPVIIGTGQYFEAADASLGSPLSSPMWLASYAAQAALADAGISGRAGEIDTIGVVRLFSDSVPAWQCPFGGSDNPPESIARRIGANPQQRIYSNAGGTQPLQLLAEMAGAIAAGEKQMVLLAGAEAIANQRLATRLGLEEDWSEHFDLPLEDRPYLQRFFSPEELASGLSLPAHYYALVENYRAHQQGRSLDQQRRHMANVLRPLSVIAADNPMALDREAREVEELASPGRGNHSLCLPYSKRLIAQDGVNQAAGVLLTSVRKARELGIDPGQWIYIQAYAHGGDRYLLERHNPGYSIAMERVLQQALGQIDARAREMNHIDIYSCFPCALEVACDILELPTDGSRPLTVTGGLPFFGGPGSNYGMHALAETCRRLRRQPGRALVTATGGILSKHAALVLGNTPHSGSPSDWRNVAATESEDIPALSRCQQPTRGKIVSYTVLRDRRGPDTAVVLADTPDGERFLASSQQAETSARLDTLNMFGHPVAVTSTGEGHRFSLD